MTVTLNGTPAFSSEPGLGENLKPLMTCVSTPADAPSGIVPSLCSWANIVNVPPALNVAPKLCVPEDRRASGGSVALWSVERISMMSVTLVTVFHWSSHARTVNVKGMPATWARGTPLFPLVVPGAAVSPGIKT